MMPGKSPFRTLFVVYFLAFLAGGCEFLFRSGSPMLELEIYGNPNRNFPEAMLRMYPGRPDAEYQLGLWLDAKAARTILRGGPQSSQAMNELLANFQEAARHYKNAIEMGIRSDEKLYYNYAQTLIRIQADPAVIDQAIANWRRNFPHSSRPDLKRPVRTD